MACILLVDENEVARRAMKGILARGNHRLACVNTPQEAWDFIRTHVRVDLIITELKLGRENGLSLVERLKRDNFLKLLPIVVYTAHGDRDAVRKALELRVQNFLLKPYNDEVIYAEIAKTTTNPWRARHFEEERSFCKLMGYEPTQLHTMLDQLGSALVAARPGLERAVAGHALRSAAERLSELTTLAEAAGAWGIVDLLGDLEQKAESDDWSNFNDRLEGLDYAHRLITRHLDQRSMPEPFLTNEEQSAAQEEQERAIWVKAVAENRCPVVDFARLQRELDALPGFPVVESAAASFEMSATGQPSSLNPLMDIVAKDPGLSAQLLVSAAQLKSRDDIDPAPVEDPRLAVGRLGEVRLASLARSLVTVEERHLNQPPHFSWSQFWMFQMGVARMARFTAHYLEFYTMEPMAFTAGLLHDVGKLLLFRLHPAGYQTVLTYAREHRVPLATAEKLFFGCTSREVAAYYAEKACLPAPYASVMRWVDQPEAATADRNLVAVVSLARDLCRHNRLGLSGDAPLEQPVPIEETPEWAVLRESLFPSFNLRKFELQVHADCRELKLELHGRLKAYAVA